MVHAMSLDDVVSKLSSDCDESSAALRNAVQTLQRGVQAEIRNLCNPWGVQLTVKNDNGKYSKRADADLKSELKDTFIAKAKEHFRAKQLIISRSSMLLQPYLSRKQGSITEPKQVKASPIPQ